MTSPGQELELAGQQRSYAQILDAALLPNRDALTTDPYALDLLQLTEAERFALPAGYHRPVWYELVSPPMWACAVCWGDSLLSHWPCAVAERNGAEVARAIGVRCVT